MSQLDSIINTIQSLNAAEKAALISKLQDVSAAESKAAVQKNRIAAVRAAANDPKLAHCFKGAKRGLDRLGLSIDRLCASDDALGDLNKAMTANNWSFSERVQTKTLLAEIGVIA